MSVPIFFMVFSLFQIRRGNRDNLGIIFCITGTLLKQFASFVSNTPEKQGDKDNFNDN